MDENHKFYAAVMRLIAKYAYFDTNRDYELFAMELANVFKI